MLQYENLILRKTEVTDALQLVSWWNDGRVMAHAGFPNGVGVLIDDVIGMIKKDSDDRQHFMLEINDNPIGEMHYRKKEDFCAEIGIKICDTRFQNKGLGKKFLSLLIQYLFDKQHYEKIKVNVAANNKKAQHVYERLGFKKYKQPPKKYLDEKSSIHYELTLNNFVSYLK